MNIINGIGQAFNTASKKAIKAYDYKRLDLKIRAYEREIEHSYKKAGRILYEAWSTGEDADNNKLTGCMENIANLYFRIKQLNRDIAEMKTEDLAFSKAAADNKELTTYAKLSKKDNDLKISRTTDGIKILRSCPSCKTPNSSKAEACESCGHIFNV